MKKFEIIEEGRLSKSEMNQVLGGNTLCGSEYMYVVCSSKKQDYVMCGGSYSKDGGNSCVKEYVGAPIAFAPNYNTDNLVIKNPGLAIDNAITATLKPRP